MKAVIQRVRQAEVKIAGTGETTGKIGHGFLILLGIKKGDTEKNLKTITDKIAKLRIMSDAAGKMNLPLEETEGEVLLVSQFTLYADTGGGNRPSFLEAEEPGKARVLYEKFKEELKNYGLNVETGKFGEYMEILSVLDGPVTIILEN